MIFEVALLALAQDHQHHQPPPADPPAHEGHVTPASGQDKHDGHDMASPEPDPHAAHKMPMQDHGEHDPPMIGMGPPAEAGTGPARAADAIWGAEAMAASRAALVTNHGGYKTVWIQADRLEARFGNGEDGYLWDLQGYYGGDIDKLWIESEGEGALGDSPEDADIQATWSHAIAPFWDLQVGARQDLTGPTRTYATVGVQGLAPYLFEVDAAAYLSTKGDLTAKVEAELDQRVTQHLILQPRAEMLFSAQDVPELGIGAGLSSVEAGLRLRYEIAREFAPYIGVSQEWRIGNAADFARADGERTKATRFVLGIRAWY